MPVISIRTQLLIILRDLAVGRIDLETARIDHPPASTLVEIHSMNMRYFIYQP